MRVWHVLEIPLTVPAPGEPMEAWLVWTGPASSAEDAITTATFGEGGNPNDGCRWAAIPEPEDA